MRIIKRFLSVFLLLAIAITAVPYLGLTAGAAYTPPYSVVRVGINSSLRASRPEVPSVTLANSSGFNFGSYNSSRSFSQTGETAAGTIIVKASGGTVNVTDSSGNAITSGASKLAVVPKSDTGTAYTLPDTSYGASFSYYGGFQFICSGDTMAVVNYVGIENYVFGVVPYEMPASWGIEALKAQALCARTYMASHFDTYEKYGFDVCNTTSSQVYHGVYTNASYISKVKAAVDETAGEYIMHDNKLISAFFHAASGGATENSENVWTATLGYLKGKEDKYETTPDIYTFSGSFTAAEFYERMKAHDSTFNLIDITTITTTHTALGNILSITFADSAGNTKTYTKESCRTKVLRAFTQYTSQRFTITEINTAAIDDGVEIPIDKEFYEITQRDLAEQIINGEGEFSAYEADILGEAAEDGSAEIFSAEEGLITETIELMADKRYTISSRGYGHNVGMSQYGAKGMSDAGLSYGEIINFYYTNVTISSRSIPFNDVSQSKWYYDAVRFVYDRGLFNGTSSNTFAPESAMTRGQLVTVLGRMNGVNSTTYNYKGIISVQSGNVNFRSGPGTAHTIIGVLSKGDTVTIIGKSGAWYQVVFNGKTGYVHGDYVSVQAGKFADVPAGSYYTGYIEWAVGAGIVNGYSATKFGPDNAITREEISTIIYRYAKVTGKTLPEKVAEAAFSDGGQISSWAKEAVTALQKAGIIQGVGNNVFSPKANCIRAQVAQILKNYLEL